MPTPFICVTCGVQQGPTETPPSGCPICLDERQYVPASGQRWTSMAGLGQGHRNGFAAVEHGLLGIGTAPHFAIGQRPLLLRTSAGNVLWDCNSLFDAATHEIIAALGGVAAISISHPHFQGAMIEWAHAFDAPVYIHDADRAYVMRPDPAIWFWSGDKCALPGGVTLINVGGHFEGATVLHWGEAAEGRGALLTADVISVAADPRQVSFLRSFPNYLPLGPRAIERIGAMLADIPFERIYGGWWHSIVPARAKSVLDLSILRYLDAIEGRYGSPATDPGRIPPPAGS